MLRIARWPATFALATLGCAASYHPPPRANTPAPSPTRVTEPVETPNDPPMMAETGHLPGESMVAAAPRGLSLNDLGRPYTADFVRLQGAGGQTLFPHARAPQRSPQGSMEHYFVVADSEQTLAASASAWGLGGNMDMHAGRRYASYRAVQIKEVYEVDDTTAMRMSPPHAIYYPWRIYLGHSYEMLYEGDVDQFNVGVQANFLAWKAGVKEFASEYHLKLRSVGHGLQPRTDNAIFARTQEEIEKFYATSSEPVPILVEWREIPGRRGRERTITWNEPRQDCAGQRGCRPCKVWAFDYVEWTIQPRKPTGNAWDADDSPPDVVLTLRARGSSGRTSPKRETYKVEWTLDPPLRVEPGTPVSLRGSDQDWVENDPIASLHTTVQEFHEHDGRVAKVLFDGGDAYMLGRCIGGS
jgi:hypothetical protein